VLDLTKPHWLAAYTKPRNEKKVYERLVEAGYETYLPLQRTQKQWSDRKKWVEEPLLRSYIFIKITEKQYYQALTIPGLVRYVTFEGKAAPIPEKQIDALKLFMGEQFDVEVTDEVFEPGQPISITLGKLSGFEGEVVKHKGKKKVIIRLNHITHSILVTLPKEHIAPRTKPLK
jgi:transcription antitermination factor NusG